MSINIDAAIEQLYNGEILNEASVKDICDTLKQTLINLPNVIPIQTPIAIVGNIHGYVHFFAWYLCRIAINMHM